MANVIGFPRSADVPDAAVMEAVQRLFDVALADTPFRSFRAASFLLAWEDAERFGGWYPRDAVLLGELALADVVTVIRYICEGGDAPSAIGFVAQVDELVARYVGREC